jgi:hypothetical protein
VARADGSSDVAGLGEGTEGGGIGCNVACVNVKHTLQLAQPCFLQVCQKALGLGPSSPVRISNRKTKRTYLPWATVKSEERRVHMHLISTVWNTGMKSTQVSWPSESLVAERTLAIRCLRCMNH